MRRREFNQGLLAMGFCLLQGRSRAANVSWKLVQELRHSSDINVEQIDLAADGKTLASWASDGSLSLWNIAQNRRLWGRSEKTYLLGTNRTHMLCVDNGQTRRVVLATGAEEPYSAEFDPVGVSANGEWWAGTRERTTLMLWNSKTMKLVPLTAPPVVSYRPEPRYYAFSPDGKWFAATQGVRVVLWDINKPDDPITLKDQPGEITNLALTRDATFVLAGAMGGSLDIYCRVNPKASQRASYGGDLRALWLDGTANRAMAGCSDGGMTLGIQQLPDWRKPSAFPAEPVRLPVQGECWSCCLRDKMAASGHPQGLIKIWKWA
ncbi:WD40 repeat domain-containing protein [bacterium]|nr:WD40 repeat domain-containing protein [bacterium]